MAFKNTAILALAALATTSYAAPANTDDFPTDTNDILALLTGSAFQASMSDALNSLNDYLSKNPDLLSSLTGSDALETAANGGDDNNSNTSGAASIKSAAIATAGLSLFAALF
ncbi:hypothetical protein GGH96_000348 [Coemansia sp. RSA 1972]|nr:hypothetical protein GGH96_000348 [Coemansia sp. RSA 1972]